MSLPKPTINTVASKQPRETAGSSAFMAFDFQVNVSMALVLDLFRQGKEFVALFDHHDDSKILYNSWFGYHFP